MLKDFTSEYLRDFLNTFWAQVVKTDTCWLWTGAGTIRGHGQFRGNTVQRIAYEIVYGTIPSTIEVEDKISGKRTFKTVVCHKCDNKRCVYYEHLYLGTRQTNIQDWLSRGYLRMPCKECDETIKSTEPRLAVVIAGKRGWVHSLCYVKLKHL